MYNIIYETSHQSRFDAQYWMLGAGALGRPRGMVWGGRREKGSGWGTHVYLWQIHFDIWQNQYNIVKLNKIKLRKEKKKRIHHLLLKLNFSYQSGFSLNFRGSCEWTICMSYCKRNLIKPAAAAAKSLQSCPTLCNPMNCSLPGCSVHGILQARTLEWVAIAFSNA